MTEPQNNPQKSISDELTQILSALTVDQVRYVVARMDYPTKGEAAAAIGLKRDTVYRWPDEVERAVELMAADALESARAIRRRNVIKAMAVKVKGLDSSDEKIRQSAATELIEWELGKAAQPITGKDGGAVEYVVRIEHDAD
jgi:hypothetical protein